MFVRLAISLLLISLGTCNELDNSFQTRDRNNVKDNEESLNQNELWITMSSDAAKRVSESKVSSRMISSNDGGPTILKVNESSLPLISQMIHQNERGFGDFAVHQSSEEAIRFIRRQKLGDKSVFVTPEIDNQRVVKRLQGSIRPQYMMKFIRMLAGGFRNRDFKSYYGVEASKWIKREWTHICQSRYNDIVVYGIDHSWFPQQSIVVTIKGSDEKSTGGNAKNGRVIIGAHLDSINQKHWGPQDNARAPGVDDNGSGLTVLTEVLRVIVQSGYRPKKTIMIMGFAGEEQGLLGSKQIASDYKKNGIKVEGMLNLDMVGYKGRGKDIYISTDYSNQNQADFLKNLISTYTPYITYGDMRCGGPCSDHYSWWSNDFPATMATEAKGLYDPETFNPNYHSAEDVGVDVQKMEKYAALAVAYAAELAKGEIY